jgi:lipopolysaccharide transport system permease protein
MQLSNRKSVGRGEQSPHLTIRPRSAFAPVNVRELWEFRDLLLVLAGRDVKLRYRQTVLGVAWVVLQPLLAAGILSFVFGQVARLPSEGIPYFVFSFAGFLGWSAFSATLSKASSSLVGNASLVSKAFFPRLLLPLSVVGSVLVDLVVGLAMMAVLLVLSGIAPRPAVLLAPVWLIILLLTALGAGLGAASLMVRYRDVQYILPVASQLLLYASPVAYGLAAVPAAAQSVFLLNPLAGAIEAFRWSLLGTARLHVGGLVYSAGASVVIFVLGAIGFIRLERQFADVI